VASRHPAYLRVGVPLENTENEKERKGLTVFLLHDPGLELDVLDDREQCMRHEYGCDSQSRDEDGTYVGLHAGGGKNGAKDTTYFSLYADDEDRSLARLLTAFASI
jgi:hypothetical protein